MDCLCKKGCKHSHKKLRGVNMVIRNCEVILSIVLLLKQFYLDCTSFQILFQSLRWLSITTYFFRQNLQSYFKVIRKSFKFIFGLALGSIMDQEVANRFCSRGRQLRIQYQIGDQNEQACKISIIKRSILRRIMIRF